ncbi:hypothetical protein [uncultured Bacteroides sp.]|uniref:hypothetical protein n=1 Tax=uncultured Bacteroides sp. TaxID=162156 RepID=UPI00260A129F|nr:hypothetical protein [uncultured Bacteroides sp.]
MSRCHVVTLSRLSRHQQADTEDFADIPSSAGAADGKKTTHRAPDAPRHRNRRFPPANRSRSALKINGL